MTSAMESCIGKSVMSGVAGFALGGAFGLFMSSVSLSPSTILSSHIYALQGDLLTCIRCVTIHLLLPQSPAPPVKRP